LEKDVEPEVLDTIRYFLLTNKTNKYYKLFYEVVLDNNLKEKIFYENINLPYKISNYFYNYYKINQNDSNEFFDLLKKQLSPLKKYNLYEYNSGIGNYTMIFGELFNNINVFESDLLHFQISKTNVSLYNKIEQSNNCLNSDKNNKIININFYNNILLENIKDEKYNILFVNYQLKTKPELKEIKTFFNGLIIILTPTIIKNIELYYDKYFRYKLQNNYVYFINF
jgi:hypothetical protein